MTASPNRASTTIDPTGEFPFDLTTYLFHVFTVLGRHREAELDEAFRPLGLNVARHRALAVIARMQPCGMTELAGFCAVDRTTMTRTVDQLVATALVERATPPADRRQVLLSLTQQGSSVHRQALRAVYRVNRRALEGIPEDTQRTVVRAKQAMLTNLVADRDLARRLLNLSRDQR
jgi:MarR family transcriptional regulator, lower aerobic nicotinate degradation pathway regulator